MRAAAAEMGLEPSLNLGIARLRLFLQQSMRAHHHARDAIAALRGLDFDEGTLDWRRLGRRAEPFQRRDLSLGEERNRRHTGEDRFAIDQDRAGAALAEPAAELRGVEFQLVTASTRQTKPTLIANLRAMLLPGITGPIGSVCGKSVSAISQLSQKYEVPSIVRPR